MPRPIPVLTVLALLMVACGSDRTAATGGPDPAPTSAPAASPSPDRRAYDRAVQRWEAAGLERYRYTFSRQCECSAEVAQPRVAVVRAGSITYVRDQFAPDRASSVEVPTIEELFQRIEAALDEGVAVDIVYDVATGAPLEVQLDLDRLAVDGGYSARIADLTDQAPALDELAAARARWDDAGPAGYTWQYGLVCFCPQITVTATVQGDRLVSSDTVTEGGGDFRVDGLTVGDVFALVGDGIDTGAAQVTAAFDPELGYPLSYYIDESAAVADEEHGITVVSFTPTGA